MKLAGLTWWRGNYGSILQAYALQEVLNAIDDIEYEIIDQYGAVVSASNFRQKLKCLGIKNVIHKIRWKFASVGFQARNKELQEFIDQNLKVTSVHYTVDTISDANDCYDGFVCGSDQVWNPELSSLNDIYWLPFVEEGKLKIAYAPSIGIKNANKEEQDIIQRNLQSFDAISCREQQGTDLLNKIMKKNLCKTVLDPTLMLPKEKWDIALPKRKIPNNVKYVFAYILRGNKEQRQFVEEYAKKHNMKVVSFPYLDSDYIEKYDKCFGDFQIYDASPLDFVRIIQDAECVFTDSFHCTVFSLLYHRNFYLFPKVGRTQNTRLEDLQNKFGIKNRIICEHQLEYIKQFEDIKWNKVDDQLSILRRESMTYLMKALGKEND